MITQPNPGPIVHWRSRKRDTILNRIATRCGIAGYVDSFGDISASGGLYRTSPTLPSVTCSKCRNRAGSITAPMLITLRRIARGDTLGRRAQYLALVDRGLIKAGKVTEHGRQALAAAVQPFKPKRRKP